MSSAPSQPLTTLKAADFASDQEIRWCPGCGDYSILMQTKKVLAKLGTDKSKTVFVSGIGCSSRFPYYMNTFGFHTIHGRAPTIATGLKLARPDLQVWVVTGDGDGLSIGGNHLLHAMRRNADLKVILFNNEIYGLTKGQYSPTSRVGTRSKSTPFGSVDRPATPCAFALGSGARFVARAIDVNKNLPAVLKSAYAHKGTGFVEIFQNCIVYNDDVFAPFTEKANAPGSQLWVEQGKPLLFAGGTKGLTLDTEKLVLKVVDVVDGDWAAAHVIVHEQTNKAIAHMLVEMPFGPFPMALGVLYDDPAPTFESAVVAQNAQASLGKKPDLQKLLSQGQTWQDEKQPHVI